MQNRAFKTLVTPSLAQLKLFGCGVGVILVAKQAVRLTVKLTLMLLLKNVWLRLTSLGFEPH